MNTEKVGKVIQVIGPVVDVVFADGHLPAIYNAVRVVADKTATSEAMDVVGVQDEFEAFCAARTQGQSPSRGVQASRQRGTDAARRAEDESSRWFARIAHLRGWKTRVCGEQKTFRTGSLP